MLIPSSIQAWREDSGDYVIRWSSSAEDTQVDVTALGEPSRTVTRTGTEGEARISGLPRGGRHFFELRDQYGTIARVGERRLPLQGTPNFRDFGGCKMGIHVPIRPPGTAKPTGSGLTVEPRSSFDM